MQQQDLIAIAENKDIYNHPLKISKGGAMGSCLPCRSTWYQAQRTLVTPKVSIKHGVFERKTFMLNDGIFLTSLQS